MHTHTRPHTHAHTHTHTQAFLYFGFTYCPDICPNELTRLQEILALLDQVERVGVLRLQMGVAGVGVVD